MRLVLFSDPLGPLWPVIGILIEAIVLFLIIFIAEKRKKSKERGMKKKISLLLHQCTCSLCFLTYNVDHLLVSPIMHV